MQHWIATLAVIAASLTHTGMVQAATPQVADAPLKLAARAGNVAQVTKLLQQGVDVHQADSSGNTALISAAFHNHAAVVKLLLKAGANPDHKAASEYTAMDYAMENRHRAVVKTLLDHWHLTTPRSASPETLKSLAMTRAVVHGDTSVFAALLKPPVDPDSTNASGYTALAMAAAWGDMKAVQALLAAGASPAHATRSRYNSTPLMESTRGGYTAIARQLLDAGADVNQPDRYGDHALNWATYFGHLDLVKLLVERGSRLDVT
jgi:ankyrin repeat protein